MKSKMTLLTLLMAGTLLVSACGNSPEATPDIVVTSTGIQNNTIIAEGHIEPIRYAKISFTVGGDIKEVLVKEGATVKKGDPLIRLGDESDTNYAAAILELANAQKALNDLQNAGSVDLAHAIINLKEAEEDYDDAVEDLEDLKSDKEIPQTQIYQVLVQNKNGYKYETKTKNFKGPAPQEWIIKAENDLALKKARVAELQRAYDRLKGGVDAEQLAVLEARLNAAKARVAAFSITAPFDGLVAEMNAKEGSSIRAGQPAVVIADFSHWIVKTSDLTEIDVVGLKNGQSAIVTLDAIPDVELAGTIGSIGQTFSENQGDVVYEVVVTLTDVHPAMRWGMTAEVKFDEQE